MSSDEQRLLPAATDVRIATVSDLLGAARRMIELGMFEEAHRLCQQAAEAGGPGAGEALTVMLEIFRAEVAALAKTEAGRADVVATLFDEPVSFEGAKPVSIEGVLDVPSALGAPETWRPAASVGDPPRFLHLHYHGEMPQELIERAAYPTVEFMEVDFEALSERPAPRAEDPAVVARTPHLDMSPRGRLTPGTTVAVTVRLDSLGFGADESGELVTAPDGAVLKIRLSATAHFELKTRELSLRLDRRKDKQYGDAVLLRVRALDEMEGQGVPALSARFYLRGRPCGRVDRKLRIDGFKPARRSRDRRIPPPRMAADTGAAQADLTITIESSPGNDGQTFECVISSPLLPELAEGVAGPWNLPHAAPEIVAREMADFTTRLDGSDADKRALRIASLRGAGIAFYAGSPPIFKKVYRKLREHNITPKHIAIVSDEPHIPWELMVPFEMRRGTRVTDPPLGVQSAVGRWITDDAIAGRQRLPLTNSSVFAPAYAGRRALPHAEAEARMVMERFAPGFAVEPADFVGFYSVLRGSVGSVLHLACHGRSDQYMQAIELVDGSKLTSSQLSGLPGIEEAFAARRPLVFLNACEVARQEPALAGVRGFAKEFIMLGASAVIAPLWSVQDTLAHEVATAFYKALDAGKPVPFAEILSTLRAKAYDPEIGEDTFAAYCFYGDPLAAIQ